MPMQDFNSFFIMFYYIFSTTYQKIGDLFCPIIILDFRTVCKVITFTELQMEKLHQLSISLHFIAEQSWNLNAI